MPNKPPQKAAQAQSQKSKVRPLVVQAIAKQMSKLLAQRQLLTAPNEVAALTLGDPEKARNERGK
jgi:hypothetical protein